MLFKTETFIFTLFQNEAQPPDPSTQISLTRWSGPRVTGPDDVVMAGMLIIDSTDKSFFTFQHFHRRLSGLQRREGNTS